METKKIVQNKIKDNESKVRELSNEITANDIVNHIYTPARLSQIKLENEIIVLKWVLGDKTIYGHKNKTK